MKANQKVALGTAAVCLLFALSGCGSSSDPFSYVHISGKVVYDDGTPISADHLTLMFFPQCEPAAPKLHPPRGLAEVDVSTGEFCAATSHKFNDGLVRGRHKVVVVGVSLAPLPPNIVPPEYGDPTHTPLDVDTDRQPFVLKVRKPH